ncbi:MAG: hypothetical protein Q4P33_04320 [Flaviflexus sp.]|nr:hypothetical protein [Flaviflexus sp.]
MSNDNEDQRPPMPTPPATGGGHEERPPMPTPPAVQNGAEGGERPPMPTPPSEMSADSASSTANSHPPMPTPPAQLPAHMAGQASGHGAPAQPQQPTFPQPQQPGGPFPGQPMSGDPAMFVQQQMQPVFPQAPGALAHAPFQAPWWGLSFAGAVLVWIIGGALPLSSAGNYRQMNAFEGGEGWLFLAFAVAAAVFGVLNALKKGGGAAIFAPIINTVIYGVLVVFTIAAFATAFDVEWGVRISASVGAYILLLTALAGLGLAIFGIVQSQKMKRAFQPMPPMPPGPQFS